MERKVQVKTTDGTVTKTRTFNNANTAMSDSAIINFATSLTGLSDNTLTGVVRIDKTKITNEEAEGNNG